MVFHRIPSGECAFADDWSPESRWPRLTRKSRSLCRGVRVASASSPTDRPEWRSPHCDKPLPIRRSLSSASAIHHQPRSPHHRPEVPATIQAPCGAVPPLPRDRRLRGQQLSPLSRGRRVGLPLERYGQACRPTSGCAPSVDPFRTHRAAFRCGFEFRPAEVRRYTPLLRTVHRGSRLEQHDRAVCRHSYVPRRVWFAAALLAYRQAQSDRVRGGCAPRLGDETEATASRGLLHCRPAQYAPDGCRAGGC